MASTGTIGQPDENGNVLEWSYDDSTQTLTITGSGEIHGELSKVTFNGMDIQKIAFQDCKIVGSMASCFSNWQVKEIDLSGANTISTWGSMSNMFSGCSSLTSLDLGNFDTSNVTDMSHMFYDCNNLKGLDLGNFDTGNVTNMVSMFGHCSSLTSLDLGNFETSTVTNMWCMFSGCSSLKSLNLGNFDTGKVTDMGSMFGHCSSLTSLDLGNFGTGKVTDMGSMFSGCSSLASLDLGNFDTSNTTDMRGMFWDCNSLTSLNLGNFDTGNVTCMGGMFWHCSSLTSLDLGNFSTSNVTEMWDMFLGCSSLSNLNLKSFDTSNVTDMQYMFFGCSSLVSLELENFDTSNVTGMEYMFYDCSSLLSLKLEKFDTSSVTTMSKMFYNCSNLRSLNIGNFNIGSVTRYYDANEMFSGCHSLGILCTPYNVRVRIKLPIVSNAVWRLPDGTAVTELPQNLSESVLLTRTPVITTTTEMLNLPDVIRVKYVPYSYTVQTDNTDPDNQVTFSVVEGRLAEGLQMYPATGEIYGVPLEAGEFQITVQADYSNPKYPSSQAELTLIVLENTDANIGTATDSGYEITQPVPDLDTGSLSGSGTQLLISEGEYGEFQDAVYLDGRRLQSGTEYTSEAGSTRITIQNQTLADAGAGSHTLSLEFRTQDGDLKRAAQNLVISGTGNSGNTGNGGATGDNGNNGGTTGGNGSGSGTTGGNGNNNGAPTGNTGNGGDTDGDTDDGQNATSVSSTAAVIDYIVQPGDNLWRIAQKFLGNGSYWKQIYRDNKDVISNPDRLRVGQHIKIYLAAGNGMAGVSGTASNLSMPAAGNTYVVQPGDTLWRIAGQVYGKNERWREIYEANRTILSDPKRIYPKQTLIIP